MMGRTLLFGVLVVGVSPLAAPRGRAAKFVRTLEAETQYAGHLRYLLKLEREEEERAARARLETWSPERLAASGEMLSGMRPSRPAARTLFGRPVVRFERPRKRGARGPPPPLPYHRFGAGDPVLVSAGRRGVDGAREKCEGTVLDRGGGHIDVVVASEAAAEGLKGAGPLRLDRFYRGSTYERMDAAVDAVTAETSGYVEKRAQLAEGDAPALELRRALTRSDAEEVRRLCGERTGGLCRRAPADGAAAAAVRAVGGRLNAAQTRAAAAALAGRITLIQGPPGTGKTATCAALLAAAVRLRDRETRKRGGNAAGTRRALACAASNVAADNLLEQLLTLGVRAVRVGHPAATRPALRNATLDARVSALRRRGDDVSKPDVRARLQLAALSSADVVVASCVGAGADVLAPWLVPKAGKAGRAPASKLDFGLVLLDEAAQATEPACLVPIAAAAAATALVLVGDPAQLPPTVLSREAARGGLATSLMARLVALGVAPILLRTQYRMHPALNKFSSAAFYGGRVATDAAVAAEREATPPPRGVAWPNARKPLALVPVSGGVGEEREEATADGGSADASTSLVNRRELAALVDVVAGLLAEPDVSPASIGIITPYAAQRRAIDDALRRSTGGAAVEVDTVDGYQGREKDIIVISTVRSNGRRTLGFVADDRRLNVALTRARRAVVLVGDPTTLRADPTWAAFLDQCADDHCTLPAPIDADDRAS